MAKDAFEQILENEDDLVDFVKAVAAQKAVDIVNPAPTRDLREDKTILEEIEHKLSKGIPVPITKEIRERGLEAKVRSLHIKYEAIRRLSRNFGLR